MDPEFGAGQTALGLRHNIKDALGQINDQILETDFNL